MSTPKEQGQIAKTELATCVIGIVVIGAGLWMYRPWVSLVVVGSLIVILTVIGRIVRA